MFLFFFNFSSGISFCVIWDDLLVLLLFFLHCSHPFLMPPVPRTLGFLSRSSIYSTDLPVIPYRHFTMHDIRFTCSPEEPMPNTWLRCTRPQLAMPQHWQLSSPCTAQNCNMEGLEPPKMVNSLAMDRGLGLIDMYKFQRTLTWPIT